MSPVGFETKISAGELSQTYALDRAATGTGVVFIYTGIMRFNEVAAKLGFVCLFIYTLYSFLK